MMTAQYVALLLSCQRLHECPDVCFVDHVVGVMAKLEPTAHNHAVALAHGFPGCFKRHPCTHDHGKIAQSGLKLFHLLHWGLHTGAASRADHGVAAILAKDEVFFRGTSRSDGLVFEPDTAQYGDIIHLSALLQLFYIGQLFLRAQMHTYRVDLYELRALLVGQFKGTLLVA